MNVSYRMLQFDKGFFYGARNKAKCVTELLKLCLNVLRSIPMDIYALGFFTVIWAITSSVVISYSSSFHGGWLWRVSDPKGFPKWSPFNKRAINEFNRVPSDLSLLIIWFCVFSTLVCTLYCQRSTLRWQSCWNKLKVATNSKMQTKLTTATTWVSRIFVL